MSLKANVMFILPDMFHTLESIDNTRSDLKIRVRITRMWPSTGNDGNLLGFNLILLDAEDYHIHAFAHTPVWNAFHNMIIEGNIYDFKDFVTTAATGTLRPVSSNMSIIFSIFTTVQPVPLEASMIPRHKFEVVELSDLFSFPSSYAAANTPVYSIDVVGAVINVDPIKVIYTSSGQRDFVRMQIYDGRNSLRIIVWDDQIANLGPLFQEHFDPPPIVIFSSMRPRIFRGMVQVSTLDASRFFINLDYEAVRRVRDWLIIAGYAVPVLIAN